MLLTRPTGQGITLLSDVMRDFKSAILTQIAWNQFAKRMEHGTISPSVKVLCNLTVIVFSKWESCFTQLNHLCPDAHIWKPYIFKSYRFIFLKYMK